MGVATSEVPFLRRERKQQTEPHKFFKVPADTPPTCQRCQHSVVFPGGMLTSQTTLTLSESSPFYSLGTEGLLPPYPLARSHNCATGMFELLENGA